jgi:hypothetical protein
MSVRGALAFCRGSRLDRLHHVNAASSAAKWCRDDGLVSGSLLPYSAVSALRGKGLAKAMLGCRVLPNIRV